MLGKEKGGEEKRRREVPVRSNDGIAFDIYTLGFGLLADAGEGGLVLFLLEGPCHFV